MKQWKRLAALSSAIVMAAATLTYFPNDTLQNIRLEISASAETTTEPQVWIEDNLTWTLTADGTLTISGEGAMKDYNSDDNPSPVYNNSDVKKIVIEDGVTSIGAYAFYDCSSLTSITIPSIVTSIGNSAFDGCRSLKSITIPDSVTSIGNSAFEACNSLSSITLSNNITSIGNWAFHGCSLTSITIPDSVTSIGAMAFHSCSNLKSITIPDSVTSIESAVFYNCTSLTSITIPNSVTSIGSYAFQDCSSLTSITLPDSVTSIGTMAFYNCTSLTSITIPDSVTSIGYNTFESCSSLTSITIPKSVTSIGSGVFDKCNNLTVYLESGSTLTSNALGVDESKIVSYWNEGNLTWKLDANGTLTISGTGAMKDYNDNDNRSPIYKNSSVKKIVVEKGVTSIGESAFENCSSLTSVMIPDSVISIGTSAFHSCSRLPSITIPDSVTSIGNFAFEACNSLSSITLSNNITSIGNWAFHGCSLTSITIPDSVTSIGAMAFHSCSNLKSITIPDSVTSIESAVFYNCTSLTSITIPDSVTSIGSYAFSECSSLTSITIPDSVTSIGYDALSDCSNLKTISLSCKSSLKKSNFGEQADLVSASHTLKKTEAKAATCSEDGNKEYWTCEYCGKYFLSDDANPETAKAVEQSECMIPAIQHKNATTRGASKPTETAPGYSGDRYCPDCDAVFEKGYTYWVEDNLTWKLYEDGTLTISGTWKMKNYNDTDKLSPVCRNSSVKKVVIEDGVTSIGDYAFYNCTSLTSITIPDSVTSIGYCAFNTCSKLTSITIPDSVTSIGNYAFKGCSNLSNITLSNNITSIGISVFEGCSNLSNITLSNNITSIGDFAFADCSSLTNITIPDSVISIGDFAFAWCSNLSSITLSNNITSIGNDAFADCSSLTSITIPDGVTSIGNYAFSGCSSLTSITIPDGVTSIGKFAFYGCSSLTAISLSCKSSLKKSDFGEQADLVSYANQHLLTKTAAKAATCSESGNKEYWTCEHCGKYFLSDDTNPETATAVEQSECMIPAIQHKNAIIRGVSEPTKTAPGYSGDRYCPDCNTVLEKGYTYWVEDNLTWKLYEDGTLTISGTGAMKNYNYSDNQSPVYINSSVKKVVIEDGVTSIGNDAFSNCSGLISITIPNSVTSIGNDAFYYCTSLTSITIPDSVTSIGSSAFRDCTSLTTITIPDGVTSIGSSAFRDCTSLTTITIPNSITSIGEAAFGNCISLTSITIPESVTSIGNYAFSGCSSLTSITIPDNVTSIGECAFSYCTSLTNITIPDSVTSIGNKAFSDCTSLTNITIPDSVTSIGNKAFYNCSSLTAISLSCKSSLKKSDFGDQANLVSYASHPLKKIEAKAATCAENGNIEHWTCEHCGKYFLSDDTNPETAKAVELSEITIPTIKHSYDKNGFCKNDDTHYQPASYNEESEKYEISNAGQLYWFAEQVNSGNASLNAVLTTDIVVNETVLAADGSLGADPDTLRMWRSIGNDDAENIFKGTFDGQGHTISGLYFSNDSNESDVMCASLFGFSAGIIQNVGLEDSYFKHYDASAGICAINYGQIVNCYNAGTILGFGASGICAINSDNGSIENCYNTGVIRGSWLVAGICNMNAGSIKDCYNNSDIIVMTDSTIIDENDEKSYASGICNNNGSSGRIENCYHVGQVSGADVNNNICNLNAGQIENSYYDCNICDKDAITQNESSAVVKNVESKTTKQFASGEVTYLLNGDQSAPAFYQNLATEKYPVLNPQSKAVVRLELIQDESFGEAATTKTTYHNTDDTVALETSPDKAYTYQYFANGKQISGKTYTIKNNTEMTMKKVPVDIELSEIDTIQLTCQKKMTLDLTEYLKNFVDLKPVQFQLATGSKLPDGLKLTEDGILSGTPKKAATVKTTIVLTAENDSTKEMNLVFIVNAPVTTTTTTITTITTTKATTTTKPSKTTTTKVTTTTKPNKTTTTKATTTTNTTISFYGDINLDSRVDIIDAVLLNKYLAKMIQFSDAQRANADCYQDGILDDADATALMHFIILLIDDLPVQPTEK